ncbi:hypothetical protein PspLS_03752 [Pyricularia sp. CBS 133598]|nr:hypothetical protein PspLS_03752 [Pyricularia sp. CBS 133598]
MDVPLCLPVLLIQMSPPGRTIRIRNSIGMAYPLRHLDLAGTGQTPKNIQKIQLDVSYHCREEFSSWFKAAGSKKIDVTTITLGHTFYAGMGGIVQMDIFEPQRSSSSGLGDIPRGPESTELEAIHTGTQSTNVDLMIIPRPNPFAFLRNIQSHKQRVPFLLSETDIQGFARSDSVTKLLAFLQIFYLWVFCFNRLNSHLPVSQLELMTSSYVIQSFLVLKTPSTSLSSGARKSELAGQNRLQDLTRMNGVWPLLPAAMLRHVYQQVLLLHSGEPRL